MTLVAPRAERLLDLSPEFVDNIVDKTHASRSKA
jgi:hypothetical protein